MSPCADGRTSHWRKFLSIFIYSTANNALLLRKVATTDASKKVRYFLSAQFFKIFAKKSITLLYISNIKKHA